MKSSSFFKVNFHVFRYWRILKNSEQSEGSEKRQLNSLNSFTVLKQLAKIPSMYREFYAESFVPIYVPTAFTPNGDGLNEVFRPVVDEELARRFHMSIYNRWGQRIFETNNAAEGWNGQDALPGVYNWVISYSNVVEKVFQLKGSVTLVK